VTRVLVTGASGQVGMEVVRALEGRAEIVAHDRSTLDLLQPATIASRIRAARPDVIVNAAAYTAVDRAEADAAAARAVNAVAVGVLAEEAKRAGALLIHYSTDYVFDGSKAGAYVEDDAPHPLNVYGQTKLDGERAITASGCEHLVLRTSWVYGPRGNNFLLTMLRLAQTKDELRVVDDQRGAPTSSLQLARLTREVLGKRGKTSGIYHATAAGETTWFGFTQAIFSAAGLPRQPRVVAIPTSDYPTPARRPANSVLSNERLEADLRLEVAGWREGLDEVLSALRSARVVP
jgi:dTDP-4-dehydrorhamnose reductase